MVGRRLSVGGMLSALSGINALEVISEKTDNHRIELTVKQYKDPAVTPSKSFSAPRSPIESILKNHKKYRK